MMKVDERNAETYVGEMMLCRTAEAGQKKRSGRRSWSSVEAAKLISPTPEVEFEHERGDET